MKCNIIEFHEDGPKLFTKSEITPPIDQNNQRLYNFIQGNAILGPTETFANLLTKHCKRGTGREVSGPIRGPWTNPELSERLIKIVKRGGAESIRKWKNGTGFPGEVFKQAFSIIFFGEQPTTLPNSKIDAERTEFEAAWSVADEARRSESTSKSTFDQSHQNLEWRVLQGLRTESLIELSVHAPKQMNEPNTYSITVSLVAGTIETDFEDYEVSIGLKQFSLSLISIGFQMAAQTAITDRNKELPIRRVASGFEVVGPTDPNGRIVGTILGDEPLTQIEATGFGPAEIEIYVFASRKSFVVELNCEAECQEVTSDNKRHVLDALSSLT